MRWPANLLCIFFSFFFPCFACLFFCGKLCLSEEFHKMISIEGRKLKQNRAKILPITTVNELNFNKGIFLISYFTPLCECDLPSTDCLIYSPPSGY